LGVEELKQLLRRHRRIALDTSVFIYQLEANAKYLSLTDAVFAWVERTGHEAVTSTITMTELLVPSYRDNNEHRVDEFYGLLSTYPNLRWMAPDLEAADIAARLRATYKLRTPDALQAATAILAQATGFITNGPIFLRVVEFETAVLDQFL
jgi:predicted nucleic acid-binding protein